MMQNKCGRKPNAKRGRKPNEGKQILVNACTSLGINHKGSVAELLERFTKFYVKNLGKHKDPLKKSQENAMKSMENP